MLCRGWVVKKDGAGQEGAGHTTTTKAGKLLHTGTPLSSEKAEVYSIWDYLPGGGRVWGWAGRIRSPDPVAAAAYQRGTSISPYPASLHKAGGCLQDRKGWLLHGGWKVLPSAVVRRLGLCHPNPSGRPHTTQYKNWHLLSFSLTDLPLPGFLAASFWVRVLALIPLLLAVALNAPVSWQPLYLSLSLLDFLISYLPETWFDPPESVS